MKYQFEQYTPPIDPEVAAELLHFWREIYGTEESGLRSVLAGEEVEENHDIFYTARFENEIISTSHLTISLGSPTFAGLGEVATADRHRGKGLATRLCSWAADDFDDRNGQALFLGTVNPSAERIYRKLQWSYIPGTKVMVRLKNSQTPEEFLLRLFQNETDNTSFTMKEMSASERITMIPLIVTPYKWIVLDINTQLFSTRFTIQKSCMGLFPRYQGLRDHGKCWVLSSTIGLVLGIVSLQANSHNTVVIDGFAHAGTMPHLSELIHAGTGFLSTDSKDLRGRRLSAHLLYNDFEKCEFFKKLGFTKELPAADVMIDDNPYQSYFFTK